MFSFSRTVSEDGTTVTNTIVGSTRGTVIMAGNISGGGVIHDDDDDDDYSTGGMWINGVKMA